jgi:hypothetical protein
VLLANTRPFCGVAKVGYFYEEISTGQLQIT